MFYVARSSCTPSTMPRLCWHPANSIYIDSRMKHASLSTGRRAATVLNVCWSPSAGHFRTLYELALSGADRPKEPERGLSQSSP